MLISMSFVFLARNLTFFVLSLVLESINADVVFYLPEAPTLEPELAFLLNNE